MANREDLICSLDQLFELRQLDCDPGFSRSLPKAYYSIGFDWKRFFEPQYVESFNGILLRGLETVPTVFLSAFPSNYVLEKFFEQAEEGSMLFCHHPIDMRCGDPRGEWGAGFVPIDPGLLGAIRDRRLSFYAVHAPLDYNEKISTSGSIASALDIVVEQRFSPYGRGHAGIIGSIAPCTTKQLELSLLQTFGIPYIDREGPLHKEITRVAVFAGCGDVVSIMQEAESLGAQAYITGEIHCHIDSEYGKLRFREMQEYIRASKLSLMGVSHAASEQLVMENEMKHWFEVEGRVNAITIREPHWWR